MGIQSDLNNDLIAAFNDADGLADAVKSGTYTLYDRTTSTYDVETGSASRTPESFSVRGIYYDGADDDIINSNVESIKAKFLILKVEYTGSRPPKLQDRLLLTIEGESIAFSISGVKRDPVDVTYILSLDGK